MTTYVSQVGGDHYQSKFQHWDYAGETGLGYLEGTASKYLTRYRRKGGVQDLEKALSYIQKLRTIPSAAPAGTRPARSPSLLLKYLQASGLSCTSAGRLIALIDSWVDQRDLGDIESGIRALIRDNL